MDRHPNVASYETFVRDTLPRALAAAFEVREYTVTPEGADTCRLRLVVAAPEGSLALSFGAIPFPREDGSFVIDGVERAVVMLADSADLTTARVSCVGEQLLAEIGPRLVAPPAEVEWTSELLQAWLPLDRWIREFLVSSPGSGPLTTTNWLARETHLRRLMLPDAAGEVHPSHIGRVCLLETPEGPNIGRVLHLATGAAVAAGRLVLRSHEPGAALGLTAACVPLLEHNDGSRQLMGVNMMRQWLDLGEREPALVQSGNEPATGGAWTGRNLLTAFIHWQGLTYEDGIVVSESCARKLASPDPLEVGDKLSNRHGTKGVVAAIVPDAEMPHTPEGRPVELIFDFIGIHARRNFGQVWEALLGNVAHITGTPVVAPPFAGPSADEVRRRLSQAGLSPDGQTPLIAGCAGPALAQPSTVGYVYWGKLDHRARPKLSAWLEEEQAPAPPPRPGCRMGELERYVLQACGAYETVRECYCTRSEERADASLLARRLAAGALAQAPPPAPAFDRLCRQLRAGGIRLSFDGNQVALSLAAPEPADLLLAVPVPHPWAPEHLLTHIRITDEQDEAVAGLVAANRRASGQLAAGAAPTRDEQTCEELARRVARYLASLPIAETLRGGTPVALSARAVLAPGADLRPDQVGLPEELAWHLFGPLVSRQAGPGHLAARDEQARAALEECLAGQRVLVWRAPATQSTSITALCPTLCDGPCLRLPLVCCRLFDADFDGDQAAVLLPLTAEGQVEAEEKLSVAAHLRREPGAVLYNLAPYHAVVFGLAQAAGDASEGEAPAGWPAGLATPPSRLTRAWLIEALRQVLASAGPAACLATLDQLVRLGVRVATASGASIHPFVGETLALPPLPQDAYPSTWAYHCAAVEAMIMQQAVLSSPDLGPQVRAVHSGARGDARQLRQLVGPRDPGGDPAAPAAGRGMRDGLPPQQYLASLLGVRRALADLPERLAQEARELRAAMLADPGSVLVEAMRSETPARVLAAAAYRGATDPLTSPTARLFVGLRPQGEDRG